MQGITPENVAGLVVGEGCFYVESCADPKYRLGWRIRPGFCMEMREDETPVLEAVRDLLGCGDVYRLDFGRYRGYEAKGWRQHSKYRVTRHADLRDHVVPFFSRYRLFGSKARAFEHFSHLITLVSQGAHRTPEGLLIAKIVATKLKEHNARGGAQAVESD